MTAQLAPVPIAKFWDNNGFPLALGTLTTYAAGTSTPLATYVDSTQTTQNTNPINLNFRGECNLWLDPTKSYKFLLQDLFGNTIPGWPIDNITIGNANPSYNIIPTVDNLYTLGSPTFSWANIYVGANHAPVLDTVSGNIGYYARTAAEIAASVTPTNYAYAPGAIERYYSGSGDARTAIQNALNSNQRVYSAYQWATQFPISNYLSVPAGVTLSDCAIKATADMGSTGFGPNVQGQMIVLAGDRAKCHRCWLSGNNFNSGGVAVGCGSAFYAQEVVNCLIEKSYNPNTTLGSQGIFNAVSVDAVISGNHIRYTVHGIQNGSAIKTTITGNTVRVVYGGGIWCADAGTSAMCDRVSITGNTVSDCNDVGIDIEGCIDCVVSGNTVEACKNAELSSFQSGSSAGIPHNINFVGNTARRLTTYTLWNGTSEVGGNATNVANGAGIKINAATVGQRDICFTGNTIYATGTIALYTNDLGASTCGVVIQGNKFYSDSTLFNVQRSVGIVVKDNLFWGLGGSESVGTSFKNCSGGIWDNNVHVYESTKTTNYALYYNTDGTMASPGPTISNNKFINCGAFACQHDPITSGIRAVMFGNAFSTTFQSNGGLDSTTNGYPLFRGQTLLLSAGASIDLSTVNPLKGTFTNVKGRLIVNNGGNNGNSYEFVYTNNGPTLASRDGSGNPSGIPSSGTVFATFAGSTITFTAPGGPSANLSLDCFTAI